MASISTPNSKQPLFWLLNVLALWLTLAQTILALPAIWPEDLVLPGLLNATRPSCAELATHPNWYQPSKKFDNGDCARAIDLFHKEYVVPHNGARYEFFTSANRPIHGIPTQRVPLKFSHGTCVITIAMRNQFSWGELPHETPFRSAPSDVTSFQKLYQGVREINEQCVQENGEPGWYEAGDLKSIAVFIWQAASDINQRIRPSVGAESTPETTSSGGALDTA